MKSINKIYLAGPFFNNSQKEVISKLEDIINKYRVNREPNSISSRYNYYDLFSPRKGENAEEMNYTISENKSPSKELRNKVFKDNCHNILDSDFLLAYIDDFDPGTLFEIGYAYAIKKLIITFSPKMYGCNLMLAESIIGHTKSYKDVEEIMKLYIKYVVLGDKDRDIKLILFSEFVKNKYLTELALKEGQ